MEYPDLEGPSLRLRRAALLAVVAMILQITALFLAWWVINYKDETTNQVYSSAGLFGSDGSVADNRFVWVTTVLAVAPVGVLFVRAAAASWRHEPSAWRRDLTAAVLLMVGALGSVWSWPRDLPFFWGSAGYLNPETGQAYSITANPGLGWWVSLVALLCAAWAAWLSRPSREAPDDETG